MTRGARSSSEFIFHALAGAVVMPIVFALMALDTVLVAIKTSRARKDLSWKVKYNLIS